MKTIQKLSELTEGQQVDIYSHNFDVTNPCIFICGDTTDFRAGYSLFSAIRQGIC